MQFESVEQMIKYINTTMGFRTGTGECGRFGVFASSLPRGAAYAYETGINHSAEHRTTEEFGDGASLARQALEESDLLPVGLFGRSTTAAPAAFDLPVPVEEESPPTSLASLAIAIQNRNPKASGCAPTVLATPTPSASFVGLGESAISEPGSPRRGGSIAGTISYHRPPSAVSNAPTIDVATPEGRAMLAAQLGQANLPPAQAAATPSPVPAAAAPRKRARRPAGNAGVIAAAQQVFDDVSAKFTPSVIFNKQIRPRSFDNALTSLAAKASKVAAVDDKDAAELGDKCFALVTSLTLQRAFYDDVHKKPLLVVNKMEPKQIAHFKTVPSSLRSAILTSVGMSLLSLADPSAIAEVIPLMHAATASPDKLTFSWLCHTRGAQRCV